MTDKKQYVVYGDGIRDDTEAIQAAIDGKRVCFPDGRVFAYGRDFTPGTYNISSTLKLPAPPEGEKVMEITLTKFEAMETYNHLVATMRHWPDRNATQISREQDAVENAVRKLKSALDVERMGE